MRFSLPFPVPLTMLIMVISTLAGPLNHAIDNPGVSFNWKRSRDIDLPNLRSRMDSLEKSQQEYRSSNLGPADKATMLEELRTQSLEAIALLEKCIQLYGIDLSWSAHNVWLQEMATNVFDDYHSAIESIAPDKLRLSISEYRPDPSFNHLLFWEIVGKMDVVTSAPLEQRKLMGLIQERTLSRFRISLIEQDINELVGRDEKRTLRLYIPHFYDRSYRKALNLPESFDWEFPADALIRDNRKLAKEMGPLLGSVRSVDWQKGVVGNEWLRSSAWNGMVKCDNFIYANRDSKPNHWRNALSVGNGAYIRLMDTGIHAKKIPVDVKSERMERWKQNIPAQLATDLLSFELYRLIYWNAAITASIIRRDDYWDSKDLQKLLATVSSSESIKKLLSEWKDIENLAYVEIKKEFDMLRRHIDRLEKQRDPVSALEKKIPVQFQ